MRKSFWVPAVLSVLAFALPVKAQEETAKAELSAGYDYIRINDRGTPYNFNGGSGELTYNASNWLGIVGDLGGYYTSNGFRAGIFSYLFGPRFNFRGHGLRGHGRVTPFAQVLVGGARSIDNSPSNAWAMTAGGGVDFRITEHLSIRPIQAEYLLTKFMDGATNRQNSFRYSAGIVFRFGGR
ncbi:MAG TPA: outer membrane beta-barrel protein [Candidatus Angelobacter sp.]|nr:outer membrane beta-barrel protein [Candidatus Angelobacter sp.]